MSRIYEALERAQREKKKREQSQTFPFSEDPSRKNAERGMEKEMVHLYQSIDALLSDSPKKVIQFIGASEGEGTSTVVREFARVSSMIIGKPVLLLDADKRSGSPSLFPGNTPENGVEDEWESEEKLEQAIAKIEDSNTSLSLISQDTYPYPKYFYSPKISVFWDKLKERFDLILIDSPPMSASPDGIAIARRVDGVVLVLEAEKTRGPVAENLKERIQKNGGNLLGIIFNKRRHYIPEFLYKRL